MRTSLASRACSLLSLIVLVGCAGPGAPVADQPPPAVGPNELTAEERDAGWRLLFDGETTAQWRGFKRDAFPAKGWEIDDGCLHVMAGGGGGDIVTVERFDDFELAVEWRVASGANSGIIYRLSETKGNTWETGPEYQVLDDGTEVPTKSITAGGLYALYECEGKVLRPVGVFNKTRLVVCGNHVEHWLNGVKILEAEMHSPDWYQRVGESKFGKMPLFGTVGRGHLALQDHGNDVWFRSIKVRPLSLAEAHGGETVALFNGRDLGGWTYHLRDGGKLEDVWSVDDGVIICKGNPIGYIRTEADYTNFILELDWRFSPVTKKAGNSGVLFRMVGEDKVWPRSIEAQLQSGSAGDFWNIGEFGMRTTPERLRGRNTKHTHANENAIGEWNQYRIVVNRGKVELEVNGEIINEAWECEEIPGKICLQSEGAEIHFRNIRLTPLD